MTPKKFTVAKLTEISQPRENPYVIVPTLWIKRKDDECVTIPYPPRDLLPLAFERIVTCQPALAEWEDHQGVIEREADTYEAGLLYVKRKNPAPLEEEVLMLWRRITLEFVEKLGRLHPATVIYKVWSRFWHSGVFSRDNIRVIMSNFVVVKFDEISTYGTNPYKCVPVWWLSDNVGTKVQVPYPSKYQIFDNFRIIIKREPPIDGWKKYTGTIVHTTDSYHEGLQYIATQDSSYLPEELMFIKSISISHRSPRKRTLTKFGLRIRRRFCKLFRI